MWHQFQPLDPLIDYYEGLGHFDHPVLPPSKEPSLNWIKWLDLHKSNCLGRYIRSCLRNDLTLKQVLYSGGLNSFSIWSLCSLNLSFSLIDWINEPQQLLWLTKVFMNFVLILQKLPFELKKVNQALLFTKNKRLNNEPMQDCSFYGLSLVPVKNPDTGVGVFVIPSWICYDNITNTNSITFVTRKT